MLTDMESIDALAKAINEFEGGMVLVSHDMRLISQVAKEIWICDNKTISKHQGDIQSFKMLMRSQLGIGEEIKLRGDASVKQNSATAVKPKNVNETSKKKAAASNESKQLSMEATPPPKPVADDATISTTSSTVATDSSDQPKKYIPPHLRKKMAEQSS